MRNNIKKVMKEQGITQAELAKRMDISQSALCQMINGGDIRISSLERIANAMDVQVVSFFGIQHTEASYEVAAYLISYAEQINNLLKEMKLTAMLISGANDKKAINNGK